MTRRTVDSTAGAYDAPGLIAVARERDRQRELGHDDSNIPLLTHSIRLIPHARYFQRINEDDVSCESVILEEVSETFEELLTAAEAKTDAQKAHAMHRAAEGFVQVAAASLRFASELKRRADDIDAREGST